MLNFGIGPMLNSSRLCRHYFYHRATERSIHHSKTNPLQRRSLTAEMSATLREGRYRRMIASQRLPLQILIHWFVDLPLLIVLACSGLFGNVRVRINAPSAPSLVSQPLQFLQTNLGYVLARDVRGANHNRLIKISINTSGQVFPSRGRVGHLSSNISFF